MTSDVSQLARKSDNDFCQLGLAVINTENKAIAALVNRIDTKFVHACRLMLACKGRIIVIGMGKSGHIGNKIAATLASTGSPAFFVHPGEASHGDLGMITSNDLVLALSYSGRTQEILTIVPIIKRLGVALISLTGDPRSPLAEAANVHLDVSVAEEACPLGLAPTASTTATLVMGDALAVALLSARGFTEHDFARTHPAGSLGVRLLLRVDELMHTGDTIPKVHYQSSVSQTILEITSKRLGMTTIIDDNGNLCGIYTDGDLRRTLEHSIDVHHTPIHQVMTTQFRSAPAGILAAEAMQLMRQYKITSLIISSDNKHCDGVLHIHDLLSAGV